jgi:hypothetical protein
MRFAHRMMVGLPVLAALIVAVGCDQKSATTPAEKVAKKVDDHSGWWCDEHALPEEVCDLCSRKYREAEKKKGNWCEHGRVKTSCFKCTPEAKEKWAKEYEVLYGTKPPEPEPDEPPAKDKGKK